MILESMMKIFLFVGVCGLLYLISRIRPKTDKADHIHTAAIIIQCLTVNWVMIVISSNKEIYHTLRWLDYPVLVWLIALVWFLCFYKLWDSPERRIAALCLAVGTLILFIKLTVGIY